MTSGFLKQMLSEKYVFMGYSTNYCIKDGLGVPMTQLKLYELNVPGSKPRASTYTKKKIYKKKSANQKGNLKDMFFSVLI